MKKIVLGCAAVLLSLGLLAGCNKVDDIIEPGPEENPNGEDGGDAGSEAETTLVKLGGYTEPTDSYHYASDTNASSGIETGATWESAPWITVTKVTGGATLSVEVSGVTEYLTWTSGSTTISWGEEAFTWSWNEDFGTFGVTDSSINAGARYLGLSSDSSETPYVRAYATSGSYVAVVPYTSKPEDVVLPTSYEEVTTLTDGESYLLGIELGEEGSKELYFFNGKIQRSYYLDVTTLYTSAVEVTISAVNGVENGYGLSYTLDGAEEIIYAYHEGTHTTVICGPESNVPTIGDDITEVTTTFIWDESINGFTVSWSVADDTHTTASFSSTLGLPAESTYTEITLTEDANPIVAHLYSPVFDTDETPE